MDPEAEALYGLPLDEFTKARDALAKARAKEEGKDAGAEVKALRKPSVTAWALNQLARSRPDEVEALLEAGARLRRAQTAALEGGDPDELREATRAEAGEVHALAGQAQAILAEAGRGGSAATEERLAATLRAAAVDAEAGDLLRRGVLTTELSPAGFGFGVGDDAGGDDSLPLPDFRASKRNSRPSTHESRKEERHKEREKAREEERAERQRQRELEAELRAARDTLARLERDAEKAEERAREARQAADAAAERVQQLAARGVSPK